MIPILKTHILGLTHSNEWKQKLDDYIINEKIESVIKVDYHALSNKMLPGQSADFSRKYLSNRYYCNNNKDANLNPLPLWEFVQSHQNNKYARVEAKRLEHVDYIIDLVYRKDHIYKKANVQKPNDLELNAQKPNVQKRKVDKPKFYKRNVGKFSLIIKYIYFEDRTI